MAFFGGTILLWAVRLEDSEIPFFRAKILYHILTNTFNNKAMGLLQLNKVLKVIICSCMCD